MHRKMSIIVMVQVVVMVGLVLGLVYLVTTPPKTVSVSGAVTSTNSHYFPDSVTFIDSISTVHYDIYVPSGWTVRSPNASYSVILPNMHTYYVVTTVENSSGYVGACSQGATNLLKLDGTQQIPFTFNIQC